jgi:YHS domain-containing protein
MVRFLLFLVLSIVVTQAFWRVVGGIFEGIQGHPPNERNGQARRSGVSQRGVQMVRDPVCGMFLVPESAVTLVEGSTRTFFCSEACRDKYRKRTA